MEKKYIVVPFEQKELTETGQFEGYGSVFGNVDLGSDLIKAGAFKKSLREWRQAKQMPAMFWMHDTYEPVGEWMSMEEDENGLMCKGQLWVDGNPLGRKSCSRSEQVRNLITSNGPKGLSIGYSPTKFKFEDMEGQRVRVLQEVKLWEVSAVPFGMNPLAQVTNAKACDLVDGDGNIADIRSFEKFLRDVGLSRQQAKAFCAEGYKAVRTENNHCDDDLCAILDQMKSLTKSILKEN